MKIKSSIRFQLAEYKRPLSIFYFIILVMLILMSFSVVSITSTNINGHVSVSGLESASMIFLFVCGLNSFLSPFRVSLANGVSRKTLFTGHLVSSLIISAFMSAVDTLYVFAVSFFMPYESMFHQIYGGHFSGASTDAVVHSPAFLFESFLWSMCIYMMCIMIGYFLSSLYYRMNRAEKLAVSVGVPVLITIVIPYFDFNYFNGTITSSVLRFIADITGITSGYNPYICMLTSAVLICAFSAFSFLTVRKATVRQ